MSCSKVVFVASVTFVVSWLRLLALWLGFEVKNCFAMARSSYRVQKCQCQAAQVGSLYTFNQIKLYSYVTIVLSPTAAESAVGDGKNRRSSQA